MYSPILVLPHIEGALKCTCQKLIVITLMHFVYIDLGCSFVYERCGGRGNPYSCGDNSAGCSYDGRYRVSVSRNTQSKLE